MIRTSISIFMLGIMAAFVTTASADTAVVVGNCNIVVQNAIFGRNSAPIIENDCVADDPEKRFNVRYIWLDSRLVSFMWGDYFEEGLKSIFGQKPSILKNDIYYNVDAILNKFGRKVSQSTEYFGSPSYGSIGILSGRSEELNISATALQDIPVDTLKKIRIYDAEGEIPWPDLEASTIAKDTSTWPTDYSVTYDDDEAALLAGSESDDKAADVQGRLIACTVLFRGFSKGDYKAYWDRIESIEQEPIEPEYLFLTDSWKASVINNPALEAIEYYAKGNDPWPPDYAIILGGAQYSCGDGSAFGFYIMPRSFFVQLAVIESRSQTLDLSALTFATDGVQSLRTSVADNEELLLPIGQITLRRGQSLVVPQRIELRYEVDEPPISLLINGSAASVQQALSKVLVDPLEMVVEEEVEGPGNEIHTKQRVFLKKAKSSFVAPKALDVTRTYIYGNAVKLKSLTIDGQGYEVRPAPAVALVSRGDSEEGSCPYLFFRTPDGELRIHGRVLVGAANKVLADRIAIPSGSTSIKIAEQEPEITTIDSIVVEGTAHGTRRVLAEKLTLRPRQAIEVTIPLEYRNDSYLVVRGSYRPLGS
jgi:hypothetical protein